MGVWDKIKAGTQKAKLQGEVTLLDREIQQRKYAFGVELYDLLISDAKAYGSGVGAGGGIGVPGGVLYKAHVPILNTTSTVIQLQQNAGLKQAYEACVKDIQNLLDQQEAHRKAQELQQVQRMRGEPATTMSEKMAKAGQWVTTNATETKLEAQIKLLDRDIRCRKEMFGLQAYDTYLATAPATVGSTTANSPGLKERLSGGLLSHTSTPKEKRIQECLDRTKSALDLLDRQRNLKTKEMANLDVIINGP